jgi:hypothetical protein
MNDHDTLDASGQTRRGWPFRRVQCVAGAYATASQVRLPAGVSAAVAKACLVGDQDLVRAERVPVGESRGRMRDPLPGRGLNAGADHPIRPRPREPPTVRISVGAVPSQGAEII